MIPIGTIVRITGDHREYEIMAITEDDRYIVDQSVYTDKFGIYPFRYRGRVPKYVENSNQILVNAEEDNGSTTDASPADGSRPAG